jgi:hypothetical protein
MPSERPTLPTGYSLKGLPSVLNAIYVDAECEIYNLDPSHSDATNLILLRSTHNTQLRTDRIIRWLGLQDPQIATVVKVLAAGESPSNTRGVVLSLKGKCINETSLKEASESSLRQFFTSMATLAERFRSEAMYPRFEPSLVWQSTDESRLCALFPIDRPEVSETDLIRIVARAFYRFATGINSTEETTELPPLSRWTKFGGEQLSNVVGRCLTTTNPKVRITTFDALYKALGGPSSEGSSSDLSGIRSSKFDSSRMGQGLENVAGMHVLKEILVREVVNPIRNPEPYLRYFQMEFCFMDRLVVGRHT